MYIIQRSKQSLQQEQKYPIVTGIIILLKSNFLELVLEVLKGTYNITKKARFHIGLQETLLWKKEEIKRHNSGKTTLLTLL